MAGSVSCRRSLRILPRIQGMTRFADFAALGRRLERARGRLEKRDEVARFLKALAPDEIATAVAFLAGRAFPASDPRVLGVRGLPRESSRGPDEREAESRRGPGPPGRGEGGGVWGAISGPPTLMAPPTLRDVAEAFADVAAATGAGARGARDERLALLASRVSADARASLARIIGGARRAGVPEGLVAGAHGR